MAFTFGSALSSSQGMGAPSLGASETAASAPTSLSFGSSSATPAAPSSTFSFGASSGLSTPGPAPAFAFSSGTSASPAVNSSFGQKTAVATPATTSTSAQAPANFSLGNGVAAPTSSFSFGSTTTTTAPTNTAGAPAMTGNFSFNSSTSNLDSGKKEIGTAPAVAFSFAGGGGSGNENTRKDSSTSASSFSFGGGGDRKTENDKAALAPSFSFGGVGDNKTKNDKVAPAPSFSFGEGGDNKTNAAKTVKDINANEKGKDTDGVGNQTPSNSETKKVSFGENASTTATPNVSTPTVSSGVAGVDTPQTNDKNKVSVKPPPPIPYQTKTVQEILNSFAAELEADAAGFCREAERVARYDATLRDAQLSLQTLTSQISKLFLQQNAVERSLNSVEAYQHELTHNLETAEKAMDDLFTRQGHLRPGNGDLARERAYRTAATLEDSLSSMELTLRQTLDDLDRTVEEYASPGIEGVEADVMKVLQILNSHYNALAWMESTGKVLQSDLDAVENNLTKLS